MEDKTFTVFFHSVSSVAPLSLNAVLLFYSLSSKLQAEDVFYRALKAGGASAKEELSRLCAPTQSSWNIMLDG